MAHMKSRQISYAGSIAEAFSAAAKVARSDVFGADNDRWLPKNFQDNARLPFLGYVGASFRTGGVVLMAINPGGGSDKYKKTVEDERLCPALQRLQDSSPQMAAVAAGEVFQNYIEVLPTWNLWRIVNPVLKATDTDINSIAFLNVVPFRTKGDAKPHVKARNFSWAKIVSPLLSVLKPSQIIALGKKAGDVLQKYRTEDWELVTVPRTNGDSYTSPEAQIVLDALSNGR